MASADLVQAGEEGRRRESVSVDGDRVAGEVVDLDVLRLVGRLLGGRREHEHVVVGLPPGVFQDATLEAHVQQVAVRRVGLLARDGDRDRMPLGVGDQVGAPLEVPVAPGGDDLELRGECREGQLEAHLVVSLAGGAVGDRIGAMLERELDLAACDERSRDRGSEHVRPLVERVRA